MPAKRMCVARGQGPAISSNPWVPEKAELRAGQGRIWDLPPSLQQPQGRGCLGLFSGLAWPSRQGATSWHQGSGAERLDGEWDVKRCSHRISIKRLFPLSGAYSTLETCGESQSTTPV